ncbi:MAG: transposase [Gemmatimonadetes bacterium]|nr:transposase [Gemmatimonadota bacterium]
MAPRPLAPGAGLDADHWAEQELGGAPLGDVRLSRRLVRCAQVQARAPQASFPGAAQSDRALVKGYYRLVDRPDDSQVTPRRILAPHRARTLQRMQQAGRVLCVLDGTELNFADHPGCAGLGLIGRNRGAEGTRGLHMHSLLVLDAQGMPLGAPHIQYDTHHGGRTARWQEGLQACAALAAELEGVRPVAVMDREADIFTLFRQPRDQGTYDLLVRSQHDRALGPDQPRLWATLARGAAQARQTIAVPCKGADRHAEPVTLYGLLVQEDSPPPGVKPLVWRLPATVPVTCEADAVQVPAWYRLRWRIEDWHRVLKTGCRVEYLGHRTGDRLERAVTMQAVIAWRLLALTLLGRETPELPAAFLFTALEIQVLRDLARYRNWEVPATLGTTVMTLARLGGHLARNHDPPPGPTTLWEGYSRLGERVAAYETLRDLQQLTGT